MDVPAGDPEIGIVRKEPERLRDVPLGRVGPLLVAFDVDHHREVLLHGRPVGRVQLVERQRFVQLPRGDQVFAVEVRDLRVVGILQCQKCRQLVDLQEVFAVETQVGREPFELGDLAPGGQLVRVEEASRNRQEGGIVLFAVVVVARGDQRGDVRGIEFDRIGERLRCERIAPHECVEFAEGHVVFGFVGSRLGERLRLGQCAVVLPRVDQQPAFRGAQHRDTPEAELRRVEHRDRFVGAFGLGIEGGQQTEVLGILRVAAREAAVDVQRFVVAVSDQKGLPVELAVPFVRRVELRGLSREADHFADRPLAACGERPGQFVVGRCIGRIAADGLREERAGPGRIEADHLPFDPLGVEIDAAQRVGNRIGPLRPCRAAPRRTGEGRAEKEQCERYGGRTFHGADQRAESNWRRKRTSFSK